MAHDCVERIVKASKGTISRQEAQELLKDIDAAAIKAFKKGGDKASKIKENISDRIKTLDKEVSKEKANLLRNVAIRNEGQAKLRKMISEEGLDIKTAFTAMLAGIQKNIKEGRLSIDAQSMAVKNDYFGALINGLEKNNVLDVFQSKRLNQEIAKELWELSHGRSTGITGSKEAGKVAKIIDTVRENMRLRANRAGADIGKVERFVASQSHNAWKIRRKKGEWRQDAMDMFDFERSFGDAKPDEVLDSLSETLTTGVRLDSPFTGVSKELFEFKGPGNLAKKVSQQRKIHMRSPEDYLKYNDKWGNGDFNETILSDMNSLAHNITLMENLGTNPRAMLNKLLDDMKKEFRSNEKALKGLDSKLFSVENLISEVLGDTQQIIHPTWAHIGSIIRILESMAKLGGATISAIADVPLKILELNFQGMAFLSATDATFKDLFRGWDRKSRIELAGTLRVGFGGLISDVAGRFSTTDSPVGTFTKLQRKFFKLNFLEPWTNHNKRGMARIMAHRLAQLKDTNFKNLSDSQLNIFKMYGIDEAEWNVYRRAVSDFGDGQSYVTSDDVADLGDDIINKYKNDVGSNKTAAQLRDELKTRLITYYNDRVQHGVLEGGARERAIVTRGTKGGTVSGEALRFFFQFKQFPIIFINKVWGRGLYGKGKADIPALIQMMLLTTSFGYIAGASKDILKGREPRSPLDLKTILAAFLQGGGGGIYGDLAFGRYNRFGGGFLDTAGGPFIGTLSELGRIYADFRDGDKKGSAQLTQLLRTIQSHTPFANLFYVKPALDNIIMYHVWQELNPNWARNVERDLRKRNKQEFWLKPTDVVR